MKKRILVLELMVIFMISVWMKDIAVTALLNRIDLFNGIISPDPHIIYHVAQGLNVVIALIIAILALDEEREYFEWI